ncbi:MAG: octanoyltransferase [Moraxellaceae bacterium]|nr:MAG: octanoyltransferase [Moraxellaceae bacterium]
MPTQSRLYALPQNAPSHAQTQCLKVRNLGLQEYLPTWQAMKNFTDLRDANSEDEIWFLQHSPVFTQGQAGKAEHVLNPGDIPVIQVDRGGQVTYHGPGQLVVYLLIDIKRLKLGPKKIVALMERSIIDLLGQYGINAHLISGAPGVFVNQQKIASLGLRVRRGRTFHGLSFNVDMDLEPFQRINPCGYKDLKMTHLAAQCDTPSLNDSLQSVTHALTKLLFEGLGYRQLATYHQLPDRYF